MYQMTRSSSHHHLDYLNLISVFLCPVLPEDDYITGFLLGIYVRREIRVCEIIRGRVSSGSSVVARSRPLYMEHAITLDPLKF